MDSGYPNANHYLDHFLKIIYRSTRPGKLAGFSNGKYRTWSDLRLPEIDEGVQQNLSQLEAIILDFSAVNNVDITAVQQLIDVRNQLDRWAAPETPEWHVASISNKWTRRALVHAGFGYPTPDSPHYHRWKPVFSVADIGGDGSAATAAQLSEMEQDRRKVQQQRQARSKESSVVGRSSITGKSSFAGKSGGPHIRLSSVDEEHPPCDRNISVKTTINYQESRAPQVVSQAKDWGTPAEPEPTRGLGDGLEQQLRSSAAYTASANVFAGVRPPKVTLVHGLDKPLFHVVEGVSRPLFHVGLSSALQSAIHNIELKKEQRKMTRSEDSGGPWP